MCWIGSPQDSFPFHNLWKFRKTVKRALLNHVSMLKSHQWKTISALQIEILMKYRVWQGMIQFNYPIRGGGRGEGGRGDSIILQNCFPQDVRPTCIIWVKFEKKIGKRTANYCKIHWDFIKKMKPRFLLFFKFESLIFL